MIDNKTIERISLLHPKIREEVMFIYLNQVVPILKGSAYCRLAYTLRTFDEQNALYAQGRTKLFDANGKKLGIVTKAKGGQSIHNYGLAFDIVLIDGSSASWDTAKDFDGDGVSDWMEVINVFKKNGYSWGGDWESFKDYPHLEKVFDYSWEEMLEKYNQKDFIKGTNYINI